MNNKVVSWLLVFVWAFIIFHLSSLPTLHGSEVVVLDYILKKSAHVAEYAVFFFLLSRAFYPKQNRHQLAFLFGLFYAFTDETHQLFTAGRGASLKDVVLFDTVGLSLSWFLQIRFKK